MRSEEESSYRIQQVRSPMHFFYDGIRAYYINIISYRYVDILLIVLMYPPKTDAIKPYEYQA